MSVRKRNRIPHRMIAAGQRTAARIGAVLSHWFDQSPQPSFGILLYHRVSPRYAGVSEPTMNVTPASFHRQIGGLIAKGYHIVSLSKVLNDYRLGQMSAPKTIAITFDDGFESVYRFAWPVLKEFSAPATVFVSTAYLDSNEPFPFDSWGMQNSGTAPPDAYRPLRTEQVLEMANHGFVEFGSHTHTHADFRGRPIAFRDDLQVSIEVLQSLLGVRRPPFAFPYGRKYLNYVTNELVREAKVTGVSCALTTECESIAPHSDPFNWGRFNVYDWDTANTLIGKLNGWYGWAPKAQEWLQRKRN